MSSELLTDDDRRGLLRHMLPVRAVEERGLSLRSGDRDGGVFCTAEPERLGDGAAPWSGFALAGASA